MQPTRPGLSLQRIARWAVVLALCLCLGLQWVLLQGVAWTGMLIQFSQQGSIAEAVSKTFDGEHPCPLCMAVKKAVEPGNSDTEKQLPPSKVKEIKLMLAMCQVPIFAFPARLPHRWQAWNESANSRAERPETPPPLQTC